MIGAACVAMIRPKAMTLTPPSQGVSHRLQCLWMGSVGDLSGAAPDAVVGTKLEHPGGSQLLPSRRSAGLGLVIGALRVVLALLVGDVLDVRSEARRVGKDGVSSGNYRWSPDHTKKKK